MKPSYKRFKKYRVDTKSIEHSGDPNEDIKVFDTHVRHVDSVSANWLWVALQKDKLAYHTFPCTQALMDVHLLERIVFRMHHRVFLNFERQIYEDGSFVYRVFMNYNHDSSVDQSSIISAIEKVMSVLQP